ncbi:MAG: ribonuclease III [Peptoniphilus sp.]|nr:ribonuclease III [Peptoniphilus sp.]MDD7363870.1 ribonuclease III [Bacillota bacterium]MDY6044291.1 ribonuclease III [Peptoniphilus sp.]
MDWSRLQDIIGVRFKDTSLLAKAFTHKTFAREKHVESYERLEFLGDSLINFIVGDYLFRLDSEDEGTLTKRRAALVCGKALKQAAEALSLNQFLLMGRELKEDEKFNMHSDDLYEALVAAIYLDAGLDEARDFVVRTLIHSDILMEMDYKSKLQETLQKEYRDNVLSYTTREINPHALGDEDRFEASVYVSEKKCATGRGRNKKRAENDAAKHLLRRLDHGQA